MEGEEENQEVEGINADGKIAEVAAVDVTKNCGLCKKMACCPEH